MTETEWKQQVKVPSKLSILPIRTISNITKTKCSFHMATALVHKEAEVLWKEWKVKMI